MVNNSVLTAQFVQSVPVLFGKVLSISLDDIIVQSIVTDTTSGGDKKKRDTGSTNGIILAMALPSDQVSTLQNLVADTTSPLYATDNGQLPTLIDNSYPIVSKVSNAAGVVSDPNDPNSNSGNNSNNGSSGSNNNDGGGGLSRGSIIGICVSVGVVVYGAATVVAFRVYRQRKLKKQQNAVMDHQDFTPSISSPIMHENTIGFSHFNGQHQPRYQYQYGVSQSPSPPPMQQW
ncbi:hypothetical protein BC941DRAFT_437168 [Chlamydoabsidia padenii]|nr:hypothetical protein BC941DRAFT_437168 [Chlamydoabsidia padenii]